MNPQIQNHESMVRESVKHFLTSYHNGSSDYSSFETIFFRLIQTMLDPPLEVTWFYSAVTFHAAKSSSQSSHPSARVLIAKDLLNLLFSCSNLSSASKKIALLAPVVYELYNIVRDSRTVNAEVEKLVEDIVSYVVMSAAVCNYGNGDSKGESAVVCFEDLVRVWTAYRGGSCDFTENLRVFFPLVTDVVWNGVNGWCGVRELVGIVLCELFFLRLYLSFSSGMCAEDFVNYARDQTVQIIKGFRNSCFVEVLLKMLLEPCLPVASLLSFEDAGILYKALYDAVILNECSFSSGRWAQSNDGHSKKLALLWLLVAEQAIHFARTENDQNMATLYLRAFHESELMAELVNWASIQAGLVNQYNITTPCALIRWLFLLEDQGVGVFDQNVAFLYVKAKLKVETGDQEMDDDTSLDSQFPDAIRFMITENGASRKRKESGSGLLESRATQVRRVSENVTWLGVEVIDVSSSKGDDMES